MADALSFTKLVPGFDFLQGLASPLARHCPTSGNGWRPR